MTPPGNNNRSRGASRIAALLVVGIQAQALKDLERWEPVAMLFDTYTEALNGRDGFTDKDAMRIAKWSSRWKQVHQSVRDFYREELNQMAGDQPTAPASVLDAGLFAILHAHRRISSRQRSALEHRFRERTGNPCLYDICPRVR